MPGIYIGNSIRKGNQSSWTSQWTTSNLVIEGHSFVASVSFKKESKQIIYVDGNYDAAVGGSIIQDLIDRAAVIDSKLTTETSIKRNILLLYIGCNEVYDTPGQGLTAYNLLKTYVQARRIAGWKVFVYTMTPCAIRGAQFEIERNVFNDLIRNDLSTINKVYVLDTDTISELDDSTNTLYYSNGLHPTVYADQLLAELFKSKINTLSSNTIMVYGNELIDQVAWKAVGGAYWDYFYANWSADGNKLSCDGVVAEPILGKDSFWEIGKTYRVLEDVTFIGGYLNKFFDFTTSAGNTPISYIYIYYYTPGGTVFASSQLNFNGSINALSVKEVIYP